MLVELSGKKKRTFKYKKFLYKVWGWDFAFDRSSSKTKIRSSHSLPQASKGISQIIQGCNWADWDAKKAALMPITEMALFPGLVPSTITLRHSISKATWQRDQGGTKGTVEHNCAIVWTVFGISFFGTGMKTDPFQYCGLNLLAYWVQHFYSIIF